MWIIMHQRSNMTSISFDVVQMRDKFKGINQVPQSCEASIHNTPNPNSQQRSIILLTSMKSLPCIKQLPFWRRNSSKRIVSMKVHKIVGGFQLTNPHL